MLLKKEEIFLFVCLITQLSGYVSSQSPTDSSGDDDDSLFTSVFPLSSSIYSPIITASSMNDSSSLISSSSRPLSTITTAFPSLMMTVTTLEMTSSLASSPTVSEPSLMQTPTQSTIVSMSQVTSESSSQQEMTSTPSPSDASTSSLSSSFSSALTREVTTTQSTLTPSTSIVNSSNLLPTSSISVSVSSTRMIATTQSTLTSIVNSSNLLPTSSISVSVSSTTQSTSVSKSSSTSPTSTPGTSFFDRIEGIFEDRTILLVVAIGGSLILLLLCAIIIFCCCCFCKRRNKGRYSVDSQDLSDDRPNHYRRHPTISEPLPSYNMALKNTQERRKKISDFAETELGPESSIDDGSHYQGHSQVQHSQPYSPLSDIAATQQSLSKLTPFNASQIMTQARGGISVDDIEECETPRKDDHHRGSVDHKEGRDSPFIHLSDNLTGSRGRISQRSLSDPHTELIGNVTQPSQPSQYSHLGLGVLHGGDVVFTNTASLAEDMHNSIGMIGIDDSLLLSKESDLHSHRTASPLIVETSADLDDTPVREKSVDGPLRASSQSLSNNGGKEKLKDLTSLTSLTSIEPTKIPRSSTPDDESSRAATARKKSKLSSITALPNSSNEEKFTQSDTVTSDLQQFPERHRRHTTDSAFKRYPGKGQSKLGKLTSLEYIRASLRMKLNRLKKNENTENSDNTKKKPLKSALRKTSSANSQSSNSPDSINSRHNSFVYTNQHAFPQHYNGYGSDNISPQHQLANPYYYNHPPPDPYSLRSPNPDDYGHPVLTPVDGYGHGAMYPPGPGYPRGVDPYMMGLSPPGPGFIPEPLSPILSVSQFDHPGMYPSHEIGILPQYGVPPRAMMGGYPPDSSFPPQPPHYDDDDDDDEPALHSPYRHGDQGGGASQRNVTWDLEPVEIPVDPEPLTPSDIDDELG